LIQAHISALPLALALMISVDAVGHAVNAGFDQGTTPYPFVNFNVGLAQPSITALLSTVAMQGGVLTPVVGTNAVLWSLTYEFRFYALYPILWVISRRSPETGALIVVPVSIAGLLMSVFGFPSFLAPVLASLLWYRGRRWQMPMSGA